MGITGRILSGSDRDIDTVIVGVGDLPLYTLTAVTSKTLLSDCV